jgi:hypothetical protein
MSALPHEPQHHVPTMDEIADMLPEGDRADYDRERATATPENIAFIAEKWWVYAELYRRPGFAAAAESAR